MRSQRSKMKIDFSHAIERKREIVRERRGEEGERERYAQQKPRRPL